MSRAFKFRVWGKIEKEYIRYPFVWLSLFDSPDGLEIEDDEDLVVEQYTGLKDKNGKEIYEGDITRDSKGVKCRVEWNAGEAHFGLCVGKQMELTDFIWMRGEDLEVIGNVHENPELLRKKK